MAKLMKMLQPLESEYVDRRFDGTKEEYFQQLGKSSTLYIGNLSFYTTEDQIYELFSKVGVVQRVIMGLDRNNKTPCGFCFVMYHRRQDALAAVRYLNGTKLDNRQLRVDIDYGFEEGRQFGRGRSGGQVRDEFRMDYDADRGGYGRVMAQQITAQSNAMWQQVQLGAGMGPAVGAPAVNPMYFGQQKRGAGQLQQQQPQGPAAAGAEQPAGGEDDDEVAVNPKLKGRGGEADEEEYLQDASGPRKRQRLAVTEAVEGVASGAEQDAEQQQQLEGRDQASQEQDDAGQQ